MMESINNNKGTPTKRTGVKNKINLDYDFNTEYGDGDIPDIDKPNNSTSKSSNQTNNKSTNKSSNKSSNLVDSSDGDSC